MVPDSLLTVSDDVRIARGDLWSTMNDGADLVADLLEQHTIPAVRPSEETRG